MPATLRLLRIRNLALVESLDWELTPGFSVVTGETGAGKSVILGAFKLILGERADKSLIRTGAEQCSVEAAFELDDITSMNQLLEVQGVDRCEEGELLLKRVVSVSGGSRQFVNGSLATLGVLKEVGDGLVDLHGPHNHQSLFSADHQLALVDASADHRELLENYRTAFRSLSDLRKKQEELLDQTADQNLDLWHHQLQELESADLKPAEFETLRARYSVASNSRRLIEAAGTALRELSGEDDSILTRLAEIARQVREIARLDESASDLIRAHESAMIELEELEQSISSYRSSLDIDPEALQTMEGRLNLLQSLQRKHRRDENGLLELVAELKQRLDQFGRRDEMLGEIEAQLATETVRLNKLGNELSDSRKKTATALSRSIRAHLGDLGFGQAGFDIRLDPHEKPRATGFETVEFLFAANLGEPLKPLRAVASSGEISRLMLALKTVLAQQDLVGLLVFDEIDANVGGEIAHSIGAKMRSLGETRQVITITHMPQVAAAASRHFTVTKTVSQGRTRTTLTEAGGDNRVEEIARMLGGRTKSAVEHAKELLKRNRSGFFKY